jgi:hypothetical protein
MTDLDGKWVFSLWSTSDYSRKFFDTKEEAAKAFLDENPGHHEGYVGKLVALEDLVERSKENIFNFIIDQINEGSDDCLLENVYPYISSDTKPAIELRKNISEAMYTFLKGIQHDAGVYDIEDEEEIFVDDKEGIHFENEEGFFAAREKNTEPYDSIWS